MEKVDIITCAVLTSYWKEGDSDYLDIISPIVIYATFKNTSNCDPIDLNFISAFIVNNFHFNIPVPVIVAIIKRNMGKYFNKETSYFTVSGAYDCATLEYKQQEIMKQEQELLNGIEHFFKDGLHKNFSKEALALRFKKLIESNFENIFAQNYSYERYTDSDMGKFITFISANNKLLLSFLHSFVKSYMLTTAIFMQGTSKTDIKQKFKKMAIYFDTTFIFNYLGFAGEIRETIAKDTVNLLKNLGATLMCFDHNYLELYNILEACYHKLKNKKYDDMNGFEWFYDKSPEEVIIYQSDLKENTNKTFKIEETPKYNDYEKNINWEEFKKFIIPKVYSFNGTKSIEKKDKQINNDIQSIAAIIRLRGKSSFTLEENSAIFITTNSSLASACEEYFSSIESNQFTPCITDFKMTNIAWIKTSSEKIIQDRVQLSAALLQEPSSAFWKTFTENVSKFQKDNLISETNAFDLKYALYSKKNTTLVIQDESEISLGTVKEILEKNKQEQNKAILDEKNKIECKLNQLKEIDLQKLEENANHIVKITFIKYIAFYSFIFLISLSLFVFVLINQFLSINYKLTWTIISAIGSIFFFVLGLVPNFKNVLNLKKTIKEKCIKKREKFIRKGSEEIDYKYDN